jgi:hypothetical protein
MSGNVLQILPQRTQSIRKGFTVKVVKSVKEMWVMKYGFVRNIG